MRVGLGMRLGRFKPPSGGGGAPTVSSVSPDIGNPAGGGSLRSITGSGFTGATSVKFDAGGGGEVSATSVTVVSDTQITCAVPAHAAGVVAVSVTTPGGTGTLPSAYEYWNPQTETLTAYYKKGDFTNGGTATWTPTVGGNTVTQTGSPGPAAFTGGVPDFATTSFPLGVAWDANGGGGWLGDGDMTVFAALNLDQVSRSSANPWSNDGIIGDAASYMSMTLRDNAGALELQVFEWDTAARVATVNITSLLTSEAGPLVVMGKREANVLYARAANLTNDTGWTAGDSITGALNASATNLRIGGNNTMDGRMFDVGSVRGTGWSAALGLKYIKWARAELL